MYSTFFCGSRVLTAWESRHPKWHPKPVDGTAVVCAPCGVSFRVLSDCGSWCLRQEGEYPHIYVTSNPRAGRDNGCVVVGYVNGVGGLAGMPDGISA